MPSIFAGFIVAATLMVMGFAQEVETETKVDFRVWYNLDEAKTLAKTYERPIMMYFWHQQCSFCQRLNAWVLSRPDVRNYLAERVIIASIITVDEVNSNLLRDYRVGATPTVVFVRVQDDGATVTLEEIHRLIGSRNQELFLAEVDKAIATFQALTNP